MIPFYLVNKIIVHHGTIIDALTVGERKTGGDGGGRSEIALSVNENITGIEFGHPNNTHWPTGTLCALKIYSNVKEYGPYSSRPDCEEISTTNIPDNMTFSQFFQKYAKKITGGNFKGYVLTFDFE